MSSTIDLVLQLPSPFAHVFQGHRTQLTLANLVDLFTFLWAKDDYYFEHPRYRLQVAFAILLNFHLGLTPSAARELRYRDVKIVIRLDQEKLRAICTIQQRGLSMVLADKPEERDLCPVSLLLAMGLADGVFDGIWEPRDVCRLAKATSGWVELKYTAPLSTLPILRRVGANVRVLSRTALKPRSLERMIKFLAQRSGHEATMAKLLQDSKRAAGCFRRDALKRPTPPVLIGRAQGTIVLPLLEGHLFVVSNNRWKVPFADRGAVDRNAFPLPPVIETQLRYDPPRLKIISHLYGLCMSTDLTEVVGAFVDTAQDTAYEPYYIDSAPHNHICNECPAKTTKSSWKMHLLRSTQKRKMTEADQAINSLPRISSCSWKSCRHSFEEDDNMEVAHHIYRHCVMGHRCYWDQCRKVLNDPVELHMHLQEHHDIYTDLTLPVKIQFCFECGAWIQSELEWILHAGRHAKKPAIRCGPVFVKGILASPGRCPYCMSSGIYTQYETSVYFLQHVERHVTVMESAYEPLSCPHPACMGKQYSSGGIRDHLEDVHNIQLSTLN